MENPQDGGDQRRGDIRVHKDGTTWVVDVGVVCPGTTRYVGEGAATVPGTAAAVYEGVKMDKYSDQPNFVPFIVETGARVGVARRRFLDTLIGRLASEEAAEPAQDGAVGVPRHGRTQPSWPTCGPAGRRVVSGQAAGYMLAQIEGELNNAPVEGLVGEFGDDGSGVGSSSSLLPLDDDLTATEARLVLLHTSAFVSRCSLG